MDRDDGGACVAIGGITVENAPPLVEAGADFLAVSAGVWEHPEGPEAAVRRSTRCSDSADGSVLRHSATRLAALDCMRSSEAFQTYGNPLLASGAAAGGLAAFSARPPRCHAAISPVTDLRLFLLALRDC